MPPRFVALAKSRPKDANSPTYPGVTFARLQKEAYPDIRPVVVARSAAETFEVLEETVRRLQWDVVATEAPQGRGKPGTCRGSGATLVSASPTTSLFASTAISRDAHRYAFGLPLRPA